MMTEMKHKDYDLTMSEWVRLVPNELPRDAVGIFQIIPAGRDGFGLTGTNLADFLRRCVLALLDAGALPVRHSPGSGYNWTIQRQYGKIKDEIADAIVLEWLAMPDDPLVLCGEGVWFALPRPGKKYVKVD
jgi:hypothetical protein